jgi:hypothetical protein
MRSYDSPLTGLPLKNRDMTPNVALKNTIVQYFSKIEKEKLEK